MTYYFVHVVDQIVLSVCVSIRRYVCWLPLLVLRLVHLFMVIELIFLLFCC